MDPNTFFFIGTERMTMSSLSLFRSFHCCLKGVETHPKSSKVLSVSVIFFNDLVSGRLRKGGPVKWSTEALPVPTKTKIYIPAETVTKTTIPGIWVPFLHPCPTWEFYFAWSLGLKSVCRFFCFLQRLAGAR